MFKISFLSCKNPFFVKIFRNPSDLTDCCSTELYKILPTISFEAYLVYFKNKIIRCFHYLDRRVVTRSILLPRQQNYPNCSTAAAVELSKPFYCHGSRIAETVLLPRQQNRLNRSTAAAVEFLEWQQNEKRQQKSHRRILGHC